jgi:hypothetical protein
MTDRHRKTLGPGSRAPPAVEDQGRRAVSHYSQRDAPALPG